MCCFCAHFVNTLGFSFFFLAFFIPYMHFIIFLLTLMYCCKPQSEFMPIQLFCSASHFTHWCSVLYTLSACIRFLHFPQSNCVFIAVIYFCCLWAALMRCCYRRRILAAVIHRWSKCLYSFTFPWKINNMRFPVKMIFLWVALCLDFEQSWPALKPKNTNTQNKKDKYRNITKAHVQQQSLLSDTLSYRMIIRVNLKIY